MRRMIQRAVLVGVIALLGMASGSSGDEPKEYEVVVRKDAYKFDPASIVLEVGDSIKWLNADVRRHLMASVPGSGPSNELEIFCPEFFPEKTCVHTFKTPGRYPYFCFIHRQMVGEVIVLER